MERELIWSDDKYIEQTTQGIEKALKAQQKLLDTWNALKLGVCNDLFRLIHDPIHVYHEAVKFRTEIHSPVGKYKISNEAYMDITGIPVPNELYVVAREAKRCIMIGHRELWSVIDGKTVVLHQDRADALIHSHDVWAENEEQKEFVQNVLAYQRSGQYLFSKLNTMLQMNSGYMIPFNVIGRSFGIVNELELEPVALREMMKKL